MHGQEDRWLKLSFPCPASLVEAVSDQLGLLSESGVEVRPEDNGSIQVSGFFQLQPGTSQEMILARVRDELAALFPLYGHQPPDSYQCTILASQDWATSWQRFFKPFAILPGLVIRPSWEQYQPLPGEQVLAIDPGMAFGTGQHSSTRMALELMEESFQRRPVGTVLDVGTGTGILAMAAALWGAQRVLAIDNDPEAVAAARNNVQANALEEKIQVRGTSLEQLGEQADLICANIVHNVLVAMAGDLSRCLACRGLLVLAGILVGDQEESIRTVFQGHNLEIVETRRDREWAALLLESANSNH